MNKILVKKENGYQYTHTARPGNWGQWLTFSDGTVEFDSGHSQNQAIATASQLRSGIPNATFVAGIEKLPDGSWK
jgi:hypothetical protein